MSGQSQPMTPLAQVHADAMRVQGKRPRGRDGRFVGRAG